MNVSTPLPAVKPVSGDTPGERDLLLNGLRLAATRSRLKATSFETIHNALRQKHIDCAGAIRSLKDEGLINEVPFAEAVR